ncbi:hypothetical protein [Fodinicola feengrottensis]|uniref:Uncharacterized protein n=1 Tax=Fodinicola feengrottensis TaxID=435914 RepID=A0ABN2HPY7_9ACTN|nr:hypothetical protein [Fodinicola feengrottensis]
MRDTHHHQPGQRLGILCRPAGEVLELRKCRLCSHPLIRTEDDGRWRTVADHVRGRVRAVHASLI